MAHFCMNRCRTPGEMRISADVEREEPLAVVVPHFAQAGPEQGYAPWHGLLAEPLASLTAAANCRCQPVAAMSVLPLALPGPCAREIHPHLLVLAGLRYCRKIGRASCR